MDAARLCARGHRGSTWRLPGLEALQEGHCERYHPNGWPQVTGLRSAGIIQPGLRVTLDWRLPRSLLLGAGMLLDGRCGGGEIGCWSVREGLECFTAGGFDLLSLWASLEPSSRSFA